MIEIAPGTGRDEPNGLACIAALASPVTHEFNNFLNLVLLQVAVLQLQTSGAFGDELAAIRRQGRSLASLIQQWQQYRQRCQPAVRAIDLTPVIEQEAERLSEVLPDGVQLQLSLASELPPVVGTEAEAALLVRFLVKNAVSAMGGAGGTVTLCTTSGADSVLLSVEDTGPVPEPDRLAQLFDPQAPSRSGTNGLEMSACETLARRRLQGRIEAVPLAEGGLVVRVRLKPVAEEAPG